MAYDSAMARVKELPEGLPASLRPAGVLPAEAARDRFRTLAVLMVACLVAVAAAGIWSYTQVRASLKDVRAAGLQSLLDAQAGTMLLWIDEKKRDAERWASSPGVQRAAAGLVALAQGGEAPEAICASAPRRALMDEIAPYVVIEETVVVNVVLPDGAVVASNQEAYCGLRIAAKDYLERMAPVFGGRTVFIRPYAESDRFPGRNDLPVGRPLVWVHTPVRDDSGRVIAALGFGRYAEQRFARLIALEATSTSREAYAFNRAAVMVTQPRHAPDLRRAGLLPEGRSGVLEVAVRDPGGDILAGFRPAEPDWKRPLTRLAGDALAHHTAAGGDERGVVLEPYRNYRGAEVIGAWRWLPEKEMAVAVEIESAEAFAPLWYVQIAFGGLFVLLFGALAAAGASSLWAVRLREREARHLGPYRVEREIGAGGMSRVYLARHERLKRPVAIKVLRPAIATDEVIARFEREVQLCSQLSHPNTIEIHDFGRTRDGTFYYAMEWLRGMSLEELVAKDGRLPIARAVHLLLQACGALREAHEKGLVHRDVKPQNLMVCALGGQHDVLKVLDFGLVKRLRDPSTRDITLDARVLGTPLYMPPERVRNPADADARCDVYGLGAVAYFILTGKPLFEGGTDHDLTYRILHETAPTLAAGGLEAPPALGALIARCLAKDREDRPAGMEGVARELAGIARDHPWAEDDARAWWEARAAALGIPPEPTAGRT